MGGGVYLGSERVKFVVKAEVQSPTLKNLIERTIGSYYNSEIAKVGYAAFANCNNLNTIDLPNCSYVERYAFTSCHNLNSVSLSNCNYIQYYAFSYCYNLLSLNLTGISAVPTLASTDAFWSTPISNYTTSTGGTYGSIYVPASLYSSFKTAANWSYFSSRFVSV